MKTTSLKDLYLKELRDLYDAEQQLIKALPKMAEAATSEQLREGFEEHLEQTRGHGTRLERIFEQLQEKPKGEKCKAMEGLVEEGSETIKSDMEGALKDAALIAAAQRVEHYEIAGYGTVRTFATLLGEEEAASLLEETLNEEKATNEKLTDLSETINVEAEEGAATEGERVSSETRRAKAVPRNKSAA